MIFGGEVFLLDAKTRVDGQPFREGPGILEEEPVVAAERIAGRAEVLDLSPAIETLALTVKSHKCCAIRCSHRTLRRVGRSCANEEIYVWFVEALVDGVRQLVELVTELKVVRASPAALGPGKILTKLGMLVCVFDRGVDVIRHIKEAGYLLQRRGQRIPVPIRRG